MQKIPVTAPDESMQCSRTSPPPLPPLLDPAISELLEDWPERLFEVTDSYGSPLNIVWPHILKKNLAAMRRVLDAYNITYKIFYAAKVNKSHSLVRAAVDSGLGVDVSSLYEFRDALHAGASSAQICGTGPAKPAAYLAALVEQGALISVDSVEELAELSDLLTRSSDSARARITLRYRSESLNGSRFGMVADHLRQCLYQIARHHTRFDFVGFHFHLSGYDHRNRVQAVTELTGWVEMARTLGLSPAMIDIGGGLPIRYVDSDTYDLFLATQDKAHYRHGHVPESFYTYGGRIDAPTWLARFLEASCAEDLTIAEHLRQQDLTLAIEPGRCLVDQAAITVFRVARTKALSNGTFVIFVEGSSFSACETWFASEFLVDPVLVARACRESELPFQAYIAGHSCLDEDVITNRLISFPQKPEPGDLLVYANTAGYQMDLLENEFHRVPMPRRITMMSDLATVVADDIPEKADDLS